MINELLQDTGIWVLISFILFVVLSYKKGKESILTSLDGKIDKIKTDLETAENLRVDAQEILAKYQRQQRDAGQEAKALVDSAQKQATLIKEKTELEFKDTLKNREAWLKQRVKRMEEDTIAEIQAQITDLATKATQEFLLAEIDQKTHDEMLETTIQSLSKSVH